MPGEVLARRRSRRCHARSPSFASEPCKCEPVFLFTWRASAERRRRWWSECSSFEITARSGRFARPPDWASKSRHARERM